MSVLHAWDDLTAGRSWTDELPGRDALRRRHPEAVLFGIVFDPVIG